MITKPLVFFQNGNTFSTPWDDALNSWNGRVVDHGWWITQDDAQSYLYQFRKQDNKFLFKKNNKHVPMSDGDDFVITKPFIKQDSVLNGEFTRCVNLHWAIDWLNFEQHKGRSLGCGAFINDSVDLIRDTVYYTREPWKEGGHVINAMTFEPFTTDEKNFANVVTWFYIYKVDNLPIYVIVFNPEQIVFADDIEFENDNYRYRVMDSHMMDFGTQFLWPKMSKNAYPLEDKWYVVKGDEFEFDIGALSMLRLVYGEDYPEKFVKVKSDLNIEHISGNKYKAKFKKGQQSAYLSLRMNTGTFFDLNFTNSKNRLVYNCKITKHYEEE
jgi:hypothetical protein